MRILGKMPADSGGTPRLCRGVLTGKRGVKPPVLVPTWVAGKTMGGTK